MDLEPRTSSSPRVCCPRPPVICDSRVTFCRCPSELSALSKTLLTHPALHTPAFSSLLVILWKFSLLCDANWVFNLHLFLFLLSILSTLTGEGSQKLEDTGAYMLGFKEPLRKKKEQFTASSTIDSKVLLSHASSYFKFIPEGMGCLSVRKYLHLRRYYLQQFVMKIF